MDLGIVTTTLEGIVRLVNVVKDNVTNFYTTKSLSEATKLTRVEPLTIISKDLLNLEYIQDVNQSLLSMFSGYYLQAVSLLTKINDVQVVKILDSLNPDRDETGWLMEDKVLSKESFRTLVLENYKYDLPKTTNVALEFDKSNSEQLMTISNLSVGKLLDVNIGYTDQKGDNKSVKLPVSVRLMVSVLPNATIGHLLASKTEDTSLTERFHAWRSGRISFIRDLIFCQDLIDEHKRVMIGDESSTMLEIIRRVNNAKKFGILTKNPSLVSASNLFVISEQVAKEIELKLGGKLSNNRIRQKAFENTYAMIIAVVDREYERVTFYTRGINASTDLSVKEIKQMTKNKNGMDIGDILKSMSMGMPSF